MDDFISRKAAIQSTSVWNGDVGTEAWIRDALEKLPAADVRPVVRGRWEWTVDDDDRLGEYWKCNLCGERSYIGYNFCPNCGADMREES